MRFECLCWFGLSTSHFSTETELVYCIKPYFFKKISMLRRLLQRSEDHQKGKIFEIRETDTVCRPLKVLTKIDHNLLFRWCSAFLWKLFLLSCLCFLFFFFLILFIIYLWLCWVFVSVRGLSPVAASGGHSSSRCAGLSLSRPLVVEHRLQTRRLSNCGSRT